ncbi:Fructosamine-3-kinase [Lacicoccus qingdaonensis]|uniref:Fructosamine-3-kinase n=2 Tax=Lacicoccus qingdaonensis TaxID=576118 RepID=A0A1G9GL93_9BACL|nr:Fructosamine-3-kinase [Salinicoccus qingdaonensis]
MMNDLWKKELPVENIKKITPVTGGDVNDAYLIETAVEPYFLLVQPRRSEDFYAAEIAGLDAMKKAGITAPGVVGYGQIEGDAYLLLEYLEEGTGSQSDLGEMVANMHLEHQKDGQFGFHLPHEGGDFSFDNTWTDSWSELFINERMDQFKERLAEQGLWGEADLEVYDKVRRIMKDKLDEHESEPSLLHGDLWAGNYMFLSDGRPALFDPSPFYGDREFDLGATTVFGGFTDDFYDAYEKTYPLSDDAWERIRFYKLYLLMVHLMKFGSVYAPSVNRTMDEIMKT